MVFFRYRKEHHIRVLQLFERTARGYLLKGAHKEGIIRALQAVVSGEAIFSAGIARRMMFYFDFFSAQKPMESLFPELTEWEREILQWIAKGYDNAAIARKLGVSQDRAQSHVPTC